LLDQLTVEVDWLKKIWSQIIPLMSVKEWSNMVIQPSASSRQAELLNINRTSVYRESQAQIENNLSKRLHAKYCQPYLLRGLDIIRPDHVWGGDLYNYLLLSTVSAAK